MARLCGCHSRCRHLVPNGDPLLPSEKLARLGEHLESVMGLLLDSADAFDSAGIQFDSKCGLHGERAVSNSECICIGERLTAVEFVQELHLWMRDSGRGFQHVRPAGQPNRRREGEKRMPLLVAG